MMVYSMTGYGRATAQNGNISAEVEVKSFNSRFLDLSLKLPKILADKELEIRNTLKERIKRGKVIVNIYIEKNGLSNKIAVIEENNLKSLIEVLNELRDKADVKTEISLENLLSFQNLIFSDQIADNTQEFEVAGKALNDAIINLLEMREEEGATLVKDLKARLNLISKSVEEIEKLHPVELTSYYEKLKNRAKELLQDLNQYDDRLKMELALLSEKYDVTEECIRLKSHLEQFNNALGNGDEVGRRLNFIIQEMNREANTINSKSISTIITNIGINIKEELEKIREQIQNIE
ncbi:MAG: YicC family protein [Ignavibacteriae bacterium HGW-Ignavibacteriae-2]|jgi:uncharacterized protein (TIGR00255 family)|nr:YicC family protein [Bacteroidota bacterium]PKL90326.1 MAG: YicC family protein [Ignavibacteriae bacterium HGW-Ignavibacteriae-2]